MRLPAVLRSSVRFGALFAASCASVFALVKFNDGHDEIFVTGSAGVGYDSNLFATNGGEGDTSYNASLDIEYQRKAGMLGVNADLGWRFSQFDKFSDESFANPQFTGAITKGGGRTTGSLTVGAKRENRADTAINLRTESWNYNAELALRYPVIERYSLAGTFGYGRRDFTDNTSLVDIDTYSASGDLQYAINSERNFTAGYRFRTTNTSAETTDRDHALLFGVNGKIIPKLNGDVRMGFQRRYVDRTTGADESHNSLTASASVVWAINGRFSLTGSASRDFMTIATDASVETTTLGVDAQYALNSKTTAFAGVNYTHLRFLDTGSAGRSDDGVGFSAGAARVVNDHLKIVASYSYSTNWSTLALSDFNRHVFSLNVTSRW